MLSRTSHYINVLLEELGLDAVKRQSLEEFYQLYSVLVFEMDKHTPLINDQLTQLNKLMQQYIKNAINGEKKHLGTQLAARLAAQLDILSSSALFAHSEVKRKHLEAWIENIRNQSIFAAFATLGADNAALDADSLIEFGNAMNAQFEQDKVANTKAEANKTETLPDIEEQLRSEFSRFMATKPFAYSVFGGDSFLQVLEKCTPWFEKIFAAMKRVYLESPEAEKRLLQLASMSDTLMTGFSTIIAEVISEKEKHYTLSNINHVLALIDSHVADLGLAEKKPLAYIAYQLLYLKILRLELDSNLLTTTKEELEHFNEVLLTYADRNIKLADEIANGKIHYEQSVAPIGFTRTIYTNMLNVGQYLNQLGHYGLAFDLYEKLNEMLGQINFDQASPAQKEALTEFYNQIAPAIGMNLHLNNYDMTCAEWQKNSTKAISIDKKLRKLQNFYNVMIADKQPLVLPNKYNCVTTHFYTVLNEKIASLNQTQDLMLKLGYIYYTIMIRIRMADPREDLLHLFAMATTTIDEQLNRPTTIARGYLDGMKSALSVAEVHVNDAKITHDDLPNILAWVKSQPEYEHANLAISETSANQERSAKRRWSQFPPANTERSESKTTTPTDTAKPRSPGRE